MIRLELKKYRDAYQEFKSVCNLKAGNRALLKVSTDSIVKQFKIRRTIE